MYPLADISKMENFATIPLSVAAKYYVLDVCGTPGCASGCSRSFSFVFSLLIFFIALVFYLVCHFLYSLTLR